MDPTKFIETFHNLPGTLLSEKKHNLFRLFNDNESLKTNHLTLDLITNQLEPTTHLETVFYIDYLIHFRQTTPLLQKFYQGDKITIAKVEKQSWFFTEIGRLLDPIEFVHQTLPEIGYNIRLKILNKLVLVLPETTGDFLFDALHQRYGLYNATIVLTACSNGKIRRIIAENPVNFSCKELKRLYKRDPSLIYAYSKALADNDKGAKCDWMFVKWVAGTDPEMYCNLQKTYKYEYVHIGRRATRRIVKKIGQRLVQQPELVKNLKIPTLSRKLPKGDVRALYATLILRQKAVYFAWSGGVPYQLIDNQPKHQKFDIFKSGYRATFRTPLEENFKLFEKDCILQLMAQEADRLKFGQIRYNHAKTEETKMESLKYFPAWKAFEIIAPKLESNMQIKLKVILLASLVQSCVLSGDLEVFLKVCQLVNCAQIELVSSFITEVSPFGMPNTRFYIKNKSKLDFNGLNEQHWALIRQLIERKEYKIEKRIDPIPLFLQSVQFSLLNGTKESELEQRMLEFVVGSNWVKSLTDLPTLQRQVQKFLLKFFIAHAAKYAEGETTIESIDCDLLSACKTFNRKSDEIDVFANKRLVKSFSVELQKVETYETNSKVIEVLEWLICRRERHLGAEKLLEIYWQKLDVLSGQKIIAWVLRHQPERVAENCKIYIETVLNIRDFEFSKRTKRLWREIKSHPNLLAETIEVIMEKINDQELDERYNWLQPLSYLLKPEEYLKLVEEKVPSEFKLDLTDLHTNQSYQFQRALLWNLKNLNSPKLSLPIILRYFEGDYVKLCLCSLNSAVYRTPTYFLGNYLETIMKLGPVSARKHGYFYFANVFDQNAVIKKLEQFHLSQSIASCFQHFRKNPSEATFGLLLRQLPKLDMNDRFTSHLLVNKVVPNFYKARFVENVFPILYKLNSTFKTVLLDKTTIQTVRCLDLNFFKSVENEFFKLEKIDRIYAYLVCSGRKFEDLDILFDNLSTYKRNLALRDTKSRQKYSKFIQQVFDAYMKQSESDFELIERFTQKISDIFPTTEFFDEFLLLEIIKLKKLTVEEASRKCINLNNLLVNKYGQLSVELYANVLKANLNSIFEDQNDCFKFYYCLITERKSINDLVLVVYLLPNELPIYVEHYKCYQVCFDLLKKIDDVCLKFHFNNYKNTIVEKDVEYLY